jgi:ribose transport system ATP-binding protein
VLGVAGLEGHGGAAFLETLVGLRSPASGEVVTVKPDLSIKPVRSYGRAVKDGTVYVPGNRQVEGLFAPLSVVDNMLMATMGKDTTLGWFRMRRLVARTQSFVEGLDVEVADIQQPVDRLSGGNQQKVLVGRWLAAEPRVLVMNDPLRGVDIGTKRQFYRLLRRLADSDVAVVLLSTEIEELVQVCDRVAVFRDQSVQAVLGRREMGYDEILQAMFGQNVMANSGQGDAR